MNVSLRQQKSRQPEKGKRLVLSAGKYRKLCEYVYERDKFCVFCGRTDSATAAHVINRSQGGDDSPNNIVRACQDCHSKFDAYQIALPEAVSDMLKNEPVRL